jgi:uncharacterized membrane protein YidH (DUF202 family)
MLPADSCGGCGTAVASSHNKASGEKPVADLRDYLAEARTFLASIRTGRTFGVAVAPDRTFA